MHNKIKKIRLLPFKLQIPLLLTTNYHYLPYGKAKTKLHTWQQR